jgi:hypothetical protein
VTETATRVSSGTYSLVNLLSSQFTALSGLSYTEDSRYVLSLPIAAMQGQSVITYNEWCGNDSLIAELGPVYTAIPEPGTYAAGIATAVIGGMAWRRRSRATRAGPFRSPGIDLLPATTISSQESICFGQALRSKNRRSLSKERRQLVE